MVGVLGSCAIPEEDASSGGKKESTQQGGGDTAGEGNDLTVAQQNAVEAAESYLDFSGFSREGLIDQLSSKAADGYSEKDATIAVDSLDVNWNAEAVEAAESYLEFTSFSRAGLIDQLTSSAGDQFTQAQAVYAANKVGL
jgi:hypothetical protein